MRGQNGIVVPLCWKCITSKVDVAVKITNGTENYEVKRTQRK